MMSVVFRLAGLLVLLLLTTGCSQIIPPPLNAPLTINPEKGVDMKERKYHRINEHENRSDDLTLVVTFSGGGTRAAALSYGVLKELEATSVADTQRTMLDEVDLISSVSGGSFTAAYYGLYGKQIFADYEQRFLKQPVQSSLLKYLLFTPSNWIRLAPALYERSDLAADYYEKTIFGKKRFTDLRRDGPRIVINATDIATGHGFAFTRKNFQRLCSSIGSYPVGRAVVASSAVPVVFSPIVLKNYTTDCALKLPLHSPYKDYLHLVDGGVTDNLGIRSLLSLVKEHGNNFWQLMKAYRMVNNHKIVFIVVNASDAIPPRIGSRRRSPDTSTTLGAIATIQSRRYNRETLNLLRGQFPAWKTQVVKGRCAAQQGKPGCGEIQFYMAELNFNQLPEKLAQELSLYETSLELSTEQVDQLILAGQKLLRQSPVFQQLLHQL